MLVWLALSFAAAALFANMFPFGTGSRTEVLTVLHLPIALWLAIGVAYVGGRWFTGRGRMDFVRFSGELFIYYVLIALGGGVFTAMTMMLFGAIHVNAGWLAEGWLVPCGATGAVIVGAWLVEAKQSVFLRGRGAFAMLERWQIAYLPVYSVWAAFVVSVFPPVFGFR